MLDIAFISAAGAAIFDNLGILFAIGDAVGFARDGNGAAALAGIVCYLVTTTGAQTFLIAPPDVGAGLPETAAALAAKTWALSQIDNVSPNLGQGYIIDSFMVVVFGGVGNLFGTLVGAISLGIVNKFLEPYAGAVLGKILVLVFIILFIQRRPRGLFALKGRAAE